MTGLRRACLLSVAGAAVEDDGFFAENRTVGPEHLRQALKTFTLKCSGKGIVVLLSDSWTRAATRMPCATW